MRRNKKKSRQLALLLILLGITVGFALLSTTLKINGTAGIKSNQWDIHWENVQVNNESTVTADTPVIDGNRTKVTYEVNLELPGDFYEFTVDAKNDGSINGKITDIKHNVYLSTDTEHENPVTLPSYILYTLYYDGTTTPPAPDDILEAGEKQTYRVRVEYDSQATTIPSTDTTYVVVDEITYTQTKDSTETEDTSIPGLWFYEINNDGEHTASIVAINERYDADMTAMTEYEYNAGTEYYDGQKYWNDTAGADVPYESQVHVPSYIKNLVLPSKVKLDAEGKYDPENGTKYTITRFYGGYHYSNGGREGIPIVSSSKEQYINNNNGTGFFNKCYGVESMVIPNTYKIVEFTRGGWYNLSSMTLSNQLTHLPYIGETDYSESLDPRVELHLPATITTVAGSTRSSGEVDDDYGFKWISPKVSKIYAPESLRTLLENSIDWTQSEEYLPQLIFE